MQPLPAGESAAPDVADAEDGSQEALEAESRSGSVLEGLPHESPAPAGLPPPGATLGPDGSWVGYPGLATADLRGEAEDRGDALAVVFFLALFGLSIMSLTWLFNGFWTDFILALVFSYLCREPYLRLVRFTGRPHLAATLVCSGVVVLVAIPVSFLVISLTSEASVAIEVTRTSVDLGELNELLFGEGWLAKRIRAISDATGFEFTPQSLSGFISTAAGTLAQLVYEGANGVLTNVLSGVFHFAIQLAVLFYLLVDGARFERFMFHLSPLPSAHERILLDKFGDVGRAILFGNGIGSAIQGILGGIAMSAVGLPSPILWGTVMTIFAFLPVVGISVVVLPATIYLALSGQYFAAIGFITFSGLMALVVENVVKTRLMGSHIQMHDMLIFMSVIGGIAAFGVLGLLYGPLLVTLFLTLAQLYETAYKHRIKDPLARTLGAPPG
ncbi:MAG: AI-2E family transporter [Myxococcota bacterium]